MKLDKCVCAELRFVSHVQLGKGITQNLMQYITFEFLQALHQDTLRDIDESKYVQEKQKIDG